VTSVTAVGCAHTVVRVLTCQFDSLVVLCAVCATRSVVMRGSALHQLSLRALSLFQIAQANWDRQIQFRFENLYRTRMCVLFIGARKQLDCGKESWQLRR
jgi:hypothetical protein